MEITRLPLNKLEQNTGQLPGLPSNPRTWTQTEIDRIANSLKETPELFEMRPVIVVKHKSKYIILAGNLRYAGAKQNGDKDVPCVIVPSDFSTDKMKEIVIKDNGSFGSWDWKALENEWSDNPLEDWGVPTIESEPIGAAEPKAKEDDFNEEKEEIHVICQKGDVWQLGSHRLMCGDSVDLQEVKKLMGGGCR